MTDSQRLPISYGARFVSVLLMAGGLLGIFVSIQMAVHFAHESRTDRFVVAALSIPLFAWCMPVAVSLWRGNPRGYRWATILFAAQIPAFCISRLTYEFSTGASGRIMFGHSSHRFGANIGSSLNLLVSPEPPGWMVGINLVAIVVVIYLWTLTRRARSAATSHDAPVTM
jgi:hypothetical protein